MISCECDMESYDPYIERQQRARKEHCCDDCGGVIRTGEVYKIHGGCFDGDWSTFKRCADCQHMIHEVGRTLLEHCGGWSCIYCGDLPMSWADLWEDASPLSDEEAAQVRRIVAMQHAVCEARGGTRIWKMPDAAVYYWCPECGEDVERGKACTECGGGQE